MRCCWIHHFFLVNFQLISILKSKTLWLTRNFLSKFILISLNYTKISLTFIILMKNTVIYILQVFNAVKLNICDLLYTTSTYRLQCYRQMKIIFTKILSFSFRNEFSILFFRKKKLFSFSFEMKRKLSFL